MRKHQNLFAVCAALLCVAVLEATATTLLVDCANGDDVGNCVASPCRTLNFTVGQAAPGDAVGVNNTCNEYLLFLSFPVTIYNHASPEAPATSITLQTLWMNAGEIVGPAMTLTVNDELYVTGGSFSGLFMNVECSTYIADAVFSQTLVVYGTSERLSITIVDTLMTGNTVNTGTVYGGTLSINTQGTALLRNVTFAANAARIAAALYVSEYGGPLSLTMENCTFVDNTVLNKSVCPAGGVFSVSGLQAVTIRGLLVTRNSNTPCGDIGVVSIIAASVLMEDSLVTGNTMNPNVGPNSGLYSGAITLTSANATLTQVNVSYNVGHSSCGGFYVAPSSVVFADDCLFLGNIATGLGGAIVIDTGANMTLNGGSIAGNGASESAGGIYMCGDSLSISGTVISANSAAIGGGALVVAAGQTFIEGTLFVDNSADGGSAMLLQKGTLSVASSTEFLSNGATYFECAEGAYTFAPDTITSGNSGFPSCTACGCCNTAPLWLPRSDVGVCVGTCDVQCETCLNTASTCMSCPLGHALAPNHTCVTAAPTTSTTSSTSTSTTGVVATTSSTSSASSTTAGASGMTTSVAPIGTTSSTSSSTPPPSHGLSKEVFIIIGVVGGLVLCAFVGGIAWCERARRRRRNAARGGELRDVSSAASTRAPSQKSNRSSTMASATDKTPLLDVPKGARRDTTTSDVSDNAYSSLPSSYVPSLSIPSSSGLLTNFGNNGQATGSEPTSLAPALTTRARVTRLETFAFAPQPGGEGFSFTLEASEVNFIPYEELKIKRTLGAGGQGSVLLVWHSSTFTNMALKMIPDLDAPDKVATALEEVRVLINLHHPHCLAYLGVTVHEKSLGVLTEYLAGGDLAAAASSISLARKLRALGEAGKGLVYLHRQGVMHADIKPSNILIDSQGRGVLGDFGLAGVLQPRGLTETYAAPEVVRNERASFPSDVYSLALTILSVVLGERPFGVSPSSRTGRETDAPPFTAAQLTSPLIPAALLATLRLGMEFEPTVRPKALELVSLLVEQDQA